ncbi:MAG TPA: metalloregulator ArsR/SmtB family transcription factor [Solirubrobacteraceae bacterium]
MSDQVGEVFAALSDPTRRWMVETLLRDGTTTVPSLTAALPITRQAVAKHLAALDEAGIVERAPSRGREVPYRLRVEALLPASAWLRDAEAAWDGRLARLKSTVEDRS